MMLQTTSFMVVLIVRYVYTHLSILLLGKDISKKTGSTAFGENITATGMLEEQVYIGDIFKIGDTILQVTQGRVPCATISEYNQEKQFLKKVVETTLTGYFFRVLEAGP